ncbi:MAG: hypothetical protein AAB425_13275 [Bdellovibrionota bacterium]
MYNGNRGTKRPTGARVSPLLYSYLKKYQDEPTSRVFAPLAEAYRKAGLVDEAIEIAREGLRVHPGFVGGRVALARALFDKKSYADVLRELASVVEEAPDNLVAQRLFADSALMVGEVAAALNAYKMLLYFSPDDQETAKIVQEMESQAYEQGAVALRTDTSSAATSTSNEGVAQFEVTSARGAIDQSPGIKRDRWVQKVELLQDLLLRVERYRGRSHR